MDVLGQLLESGLIVQLFQTAQNSEKIVTLRSKTGQTAQGTGASITEAAIAAMLTMITKLESQVEAERAVKLNLRLYGVEIPGD